MSVTANVEEFLAKSYDIVIVGAGTAGLALAARLSEDPRIHVGVLEAGDDKRDDPVISSGGGWIHTAVDPKNFWGFSTTPQENLRVPGQAEGRVLDLPRGKLFGGSSSINAATWTRAAKPEYDALESVFKNEGWNFDSLLPYFKKSHTHTPAPSKLFGDDGTPKPSHGTEGPIKTSCNWWQSPIAEPFVKSLQALSHKVNLDPDGGNANGIVNLARSIDPATSKRSSAAYTYFAEAAGRPNLTVLTGALACEVIFQESAKGLIADGVKFRVGDAVHIVAAKREVVLSTGTYQTPQLLELSGIGLKSVLEKFGIPVKIELPVGENLQEHLSVQLMYEFKDSETLQSVLGKGLDPEHVGNPDTKRFPPQNSVTGGPILTSRMKDLRPANSSAADFTRLVARLDELIASRDISPLKRAQLALQREWLTNDGAGVTEAKFILAGIPGTIGLPTPTGTFMLWIPICHAHPSSRGSIHINSTDPAAHPAIDLGVMDEYDLESWVWMLKFADNVVRTEPLASLVKHQPPRTDDEWRALATSTAGVMFHPVGTTPMCPRAMDGVVDSHLKVYGTVNLRVVDASIFPLQLGAMPQATIYAAAEKAADLIKLELV
ncbi:alcohol oxidase [Exidia glandulosa HHB12029]|uniref:Alcohol oxidase n=1 Tax=Exidia glandulosa HHB12029 TaxID=1314781 RepID=A0A165CUB2_EXIGL|nr:alcohol oxidase [Exidia glandulosa HHB12029]